MEPWVPGAIAGSLGVVAAVLSGLTVGWLQARRERKARDHASSAPGAPSVQQVWDRQDKQERALGAALVLLGQVVEQHDEPHKLVLNKAAIKTLRETGFMPSELEDVLTENESNKGAKP